jgi:hypothetical protein
MRAVPDVYPPPGMVMTTGGGLAKEVYPRDPNNVLLWGGAVPSQSSQQPIDTNNRNEPEEIVKEEEGMND